MAAAAAAAAAVAAEAVFRGARYLPPSPLSVGSDADPTAAATMVFGSLAPRNYAPTVFEPAPADNGEGWHRRGRHLAAGIGTGCARAGVPQGASERRG